MSELQTQSAVRAAAVPKTEPWRWIVVLGLGFAFYFAPVPGLNAGQRHLVAIFVATIVALVAQPIPMGASVVVAMTILALTRTVPPTKVLSGFSNTTVWLIFTAFLFARAVTATGFGLRVAYLFIRRFGHSSLTLGYSIAAADAVLGPFVPSDTARGGGIIYPIARSLAQAFDSEPGPSARRLGAFLMLVGFHTTYTASAMFLTSMAANPLIAEFAHKIAGVDLTWLRWAEASIVPGLLSLTLVPLLIYKLYPPEIRNTEAARQLARDELKSMGRMSRRELSLVLILFGVMLGWVTSPWHGINNAFVALAGISAILICRVLAWDDLLSERKAWDALIWFGPLLMMADMLNESGVIKVASAAVFVHLNGWPWMLAMATLVVSYLYLHYGFASMTAQITALYPGFLASAVAIGAPPLLAAFLLAFFSNLNAGITHYGTGSAPVYFGAGYVPQSTWWRLGFLISLLNIVFWLGIGSLWWKLLGLW
ncbi:MAG TPA: DASS family sodium-coupled anion symporter [Bryobacteraceae bacterium]|nr:DASS family sodium-coupled anion symporter [Bryobacteraceae bacterium]